MADKKEIEKILELSGNAAERYKVADDKDVMKQRTSIWSALHADELDEAARLAGELDHIIAHAISKHRED